jgi:hypothetical protein
MRYQYLFPASLRTVDTGDAYGLPFGQRVAYPKADVIGRPMISPGQASSARLRSRARKNTGGCTDIGRPVRMFFNFGHGPRGRAC